MLKVENIRFCYSKNQIILNDISFELKSREVLCLLGPNGTGKTTLLRCLLSLNKPISGKILIDGFDLLKTPSRKRATYLAYVPQASTMSFPYEVEEIVMMGRTAHLGLGASPTKKDRDICLEVLDTLGILHLKSKQFSKMSGGERQMVLLARAMAQQARILVMDEPTANLDYSNQVKILQTVNNLSNQGYSILMTSHFPDHAFLACDQVLLMRDGVIMAGGPPDETVTSDSLSRLYNTKVCVTMATLFPENTSTKVCVPVMNKPNKVKENN